MIRVEIPGRGLLVIEHLVLDFNGTMAKDGVLIPGVEERLNRLAGQLTVHVLTADTFGTGREACRNIKAAVHLLEPGEGGSQKEKFINRLGAEQTVTVGNGANDSLMLAAAALGIIVLGPEGTSVRSLQSADVVVTDINDGLDMLLHPKRLVATLRT
ncbi:HAD family hydrolase [Desulfotomaculum copahuensis]|uniref:ATPase P n=1 Tax=Desulfotomaculum copahuensis TaxID=1838280 RepID=A0A1B7LE39_9FIRM|nr:HAD family hydrolase [Desulfotomaculum copahuensis]OAT81363.1 ATPase P [Desulfotomaculum copahuensis]